MKLRLDTIVLAMAFTLPTLCFADWPGFRGPYGDGIASEGSCPLTWGAEENIAWKVALPQPGNGSPIVVGGRVFLTSTEDDAGTYRSTYCFDAKTGKQLWVKTVECDEEPHHKTNPHGSSTPVSEGQKVIVWHASAGLVCYDLDGNKIWSRDLGKFRHMWGYGSSPIILQGKVILYTGPGEKSFVTALHLETGKPIWQQVETEAGSIDRREDKAPHGSWCTPVVAQVDGENQIIVLHPKRVVAYEAESGKIVWSCDGLSHDRGDLAYSSPVIAGDLCFVVGGYKGPMMSIRIDGKGDVTESHRLFRHEDSNQSIGSGVYFRDHVYIPFAEAGKGLQCIDPSTGEDRWSQRTSAAHWGSLVLCDGRCYVTSQDGTTTVFNPTSESYEELAVNKLGETCNGTPAISDGHIYIRTHEHLYCIGK